MGFIATPRVVGLTPSHLTAPALPSTLFACCALDSVPIVAMHASSTSLCSPEGNRTVAYPSSPFLTSTAEVPAARTILPPWPGRSSMLWTLVPTGISFRGMAFPGRMSTPPSVDATIVLPARMPSAART